MKAITIPTLLMAASLSLPVGVSAQTNTQSGTSDSKANAAAGETQRPTAQPYGEGGSKRCDELSGTSKQECLQDEGAKTDRSQEPAAAAPDSQSSAGSSAGGDSAPGAKGAGTTVSED